MEQQILIFFGNNYSFQNEGQQVAGTGIYYLADTTLSPVAGADSKGQRYVKATLPYESFNKLVEVPGIYNAKMSLSPDSKGGMTVKVDDVDFVSSVKVSSKG